MARIRNAGVTLVELMVGVIVAGIVAAVVVPRFTAQRGEARLAVLDASLEEVRSAVELYAYQHNGAYPGAHDAADPSRPSAHPEEDFLQQLTLHTDADGAVHEGKDPRHPLGPYLQQPELPRNPYTNTNTLAVTTDDGAVSPPAVDGTSAWRFSTRTGRFYANQSGRETR